MKKILTFVDYFLPGYQAGGPLVSLANIVELLNGEIEFYIVTKDRDLGAQNPYENIKYGEWNKLNNMKVLYLSPNQFSFGRLLKIIRANNWDKIYLNSFFSKLSIKIILLRKIFNIKTPILLAPRGEFSKGALDIKRLKKNFYLKLAKFLSLYRNVTWHVTDNNELADLQKNWKENIIYKIGRDPIIYDESYFHKTIEKQANSCRMVFISRISRMKNLHIGLEILKKITDAKIIFDIYGPVEDQTYWSQCRRLIDQAPNNIEINYCGQIVHENVYATIAKYHCLFLPTAGENFGHAIFESFMVGRPVLIGNNTPWKNLKAKNIGADIDPQNQEGFIREINKFLAMKQEEFNKMVMSCHEFALSIADYEKQREEQKTLFF